MSRQKNSILINEHALNRKPIPLRENGKLSIHENLVMTSPYVHSFVRTDSRVEVSTNEFLPSPLESFVPYCFKRVQK